jgi:hypothetical protein
MADNNTGTLFHFTKEYQTLERILLEGLRLTYCKEEFFDSILGIPMVSFCDIPLSRTNIIREHYGNYVIGFDKEKLLTDENNKKFCLNPVIYCHSEWLKNGLSSLKTEYEAVMKEIASSTQETEHSNCCVITKDNSAIIAGKQANALITKNLSNSILGFTKPYIGTLENRKRVTFYNEREWRLVIPEDHFHIDGKLCKWLRNEEEYKEWRGDRNNDKKFFDASIGNIEIITHLIVEKEAEIPLLVDYIWNLDSVMKEEKIDESQRRILISRITSFERIEKDY